MCNTSDLFHIFKQFNLSSVKFKNIKLALLFKLKLWYFITLACDKPDLGLEELTSLNVKSRYQAFENATTNGNSNMEKSPVSVKRSPSIMSKLAK